jgi:hypothetical protein
MRALCIAAFCFLVICLVAGKQLVEAPGSPLAPGHHKPLHPHAIGKAGHHLLAGKWYSPPTTTVGDVTVIIDAVDNKTFSGALNANAAGGGIKTRIHGIYNERAGSLIFITKSTGKTGTSETELWLGSISSGLKPAEPTRMVFDVVTMPDDTTKFRNERFTLVKTAAQQGK